MAKKKTTEQFIEDARKVHGDKYDYSKVTYIDSRTKIEIICPIHGSFMQLPNAHLRGADCRQCSIHKRSNERMYTTEYFVKQSKLIHNNKYSYEKVIYTKCNKKVIITCPIHGDFEQTPTCHLQGQGCPECGKLQKANSHRTKWEDLLKRFRKIHGDTFEYEQNGYKSINDKIKIFCKKHNYWFEQQITHHLDGRGCPICNGGSKRNTEMFVIKAREIHGDKYDYSKVNYITKDNPVEIICPKHGSFWQKAHDHICGCGCPRCRSFRNQEFIFEFLKKSFPKEEWLWEFSPSWLGIQRLDIYNSRVNLAIEYNGQQHYFPIDVFGGEEGFKKCTEHDALKAQLCKDNNCKLYIIKYDDVDYDRIREDISNILNLN